MTEKEIQSHLQTKLFGRALILRKEVDSTNRLLLSEAAKGAPEGLVALCETQTAGRGRQRRLWHSPPDCNLYFSLLVRPSCPPVRLPQLAVLAAVALHRALASCAPELPVDLKWPNDLWIHGRKISGILCECESGGVCQKGDLAIVVGIGLNVNAKREDFPPELRESASSLALMAGHPFDRAKVLASFLLAWEKCYEEWKRGGELTPFLEYWRCYDMLVGKKVTILRPTDTLETKVHGMAPDGRLLVEDNTGGIMPITAGDVHLR